METNSTIHIGSKRTSDVQAKQMVSEKPKNFIDQLNGYIVKLTPIKDQDKVSFFRLLATMINAGISIVKALYILRDQIENPHFKQVIQQIAEGIEGGKSFSESLSDFPNYFTDAQVGMVESGEASGRLNDTLLQIATQTEKSASLVSRIKGAMIYPVTIIVLMIAAGFAVMTFVMPKLKEMFDSLGGELPTITKVLIAISDFLVGKTAGIMNAFWMIGVLIGLVFVFLWWKKTKIGRYLWAEAVLSMPIFGKLSRQIALARFCRSLSSLISSGVSIIKALNITAETVGNAVYEKRIKLIADDVKQGIPMADNMKDDEKHFPSMVVGMIGVAEQTAQVDQITERLADFYEAEVDDKIKNLSSLIEPIIIVVLGTGVGFLVISVMLPILQSSDLATMG